MIEQFKHASCQILFFSSRRRLTRWPRDWSSDVCSSDLGAWRGITPATSGNLALVSAGSQTAHGPAATTRCVAVRPVCTSTVRTNGLASKTGNAGTRTSSRSEERRGGKEEEDSGEEDV